MHPTHHAIWGQDLINELRLQGYSNSQIVGNTGIRIQALEGDRPLVPFDKLASLFEHAAVLTGDDLLGFKLGQGREFRRGGLVTYVGMAAPTVKRFLQNVDRFQRVMSDAVRIDTQRLEGEGIVEWGYLVPQTVMRRQYLEFTATRIVDMLRRLTNRQFDLEKLELHFHRTTNIEPLQQFFGCPLEFGSDDNRMHLKTDQLTMDLRTSDIYLQDTLLECCEAALSAKKTVQTPLVVAVEREIATGHTSQNAVANALAMSSRTLARRLSEQGTTFFSVVEGYRAALAKSLISNTDLQITEIAFLVGYSSLSTFSTAFRRWTGQSPKQYQMQAG